jgi:polyhydroxyalkanoate synthesis regulator phasin
MKKPVQESIQQAVQKAWSETVSTLQTVEEEVARRFRQALEKADVQHGTEEAQRLLADFGRRLQQNSEAVGQRIEESVRSVYSRVKEPLFEEITHLKSRAEELSRRIESQVRRRGGSTPPADGDKGPPSSGGGSTPT